VIKDLNFSTHQHNVPNKSSRSGAGGLEAYEEEEDGGECRLSLDLVYAREPCVAMMDPQPIL
jgi:hypothetical protein